MPGDFEADTAVEPAGKGRWRCRVEPAWWIARGPNGGTIAAILVRAIEAEVADLSRPPRSLTVHYLRPPAEGEGMVSVTLERSGRTVSTATARLEQQGRLIAIAISALAGPREGRIALDEAPMPDVPPPDEVPVLDRRSPPLPFVENFEFRLAIGHPPFSKAGEALAGGWLRLAAERPVDAALVAQYTDAWYPPVFVETDGPAAIPTVDLTVHIRAPLDLLEPGSWLLGRWSTRLARDGFLEEDGELWAPDGTLVAHSRQLALAV